MIETTANKVIISGFFIREPSDDNSLLAAICSNRKTVGNTVNHGRKTGAKIKKIHNRKIILCASKGGTFERENCFVTPLDGLNGRDASRLRAPWLHSTLYIPDKSGEPTSENPRERNSPGGLRCQRILPPRGRVTTLAPLPFFFRRAFIAIKVKIKHEDESIIEKLDLEMRQITTGGNKVENFRMVDVERITNGRALQKTRNRGILNGAEREGFKLILFEATYLNEVDFKSRVDASNNNMNL